MADIFTAVADATRRDILQLLLESDDGLTAALLATEIGVTAPTIQKHAKVLSDAGLIEVTADSPPRFTLDIDPLEELADWLLPFLDEDAAAHASDGALAVFSAWSGADAGATIGRVIADRSHRARAVIEDASDKVAQHLPHAITHRRSTSL